MQARVKPQRERQIEPETLVELGVVVRGARERTGEDRQRRVHRRQADRHIDRKTWKGSDAEKR